MAAVLERNMNKRSLTSKLLLETQIVGETKEQTRDKQIKRN